MSQILIKDLIDAVDKVDSSVVVLNSTTADVETAVVAVENVTADVEAAVVALESTTAGLEFPIEDNLPSKTTNDGDRADLIGFSTNTLFGTLVSAPGVGKRIVVHEVIGFVINNSSATILRFFSAAINMFAFAVKASDTGNYNFSFGPRGYPCDPNDAFTFFFSTTVSTHEAHVLYSIEDV